MFQNFAVKINLPKFVLTKLKQVISLDVKFPFYAPLFTELPYIFRENRKTYCMN